MGLSLAVVHLIAPLLGDFDRRRSQKILTLGVQDCHFRYDELVAFLRRHGLPHRTLQQNEIAYTSGFKWAAEDQALRYERNVHQRTFFAVLGFDPQNVQAIDASSFEEATYVHDLNNAVDGGLESAFDIVLDSGTIEHVFSLKDSLFNVARLCKVGGKVLLLSPTDMINHGFININAELFRDFFTLNEFEELSLRYVLFPRHERRRNEHYLLLPLEALTTSIPAYNALVFGAYEKKRQAPLRVPQQGYYCRLWKAGEQKTPRLSVSRARAVIQQWIDSSFLLSVVARSVHVRRAAMKVRL